MLQQTRVDTVIPYYEKFVRTYPTVAALARANLDQVLKAWEGLGYYSRARNLHSAAKEVVEKYGSELPRSAEELRSLKGFGPYTSAAVASIAFGEPVPTIDGNVRRVASRLFESEENLEERLQEMIDPMDPSSFNQGMMELGATICLPKKPSCLSCPVRGHCGAHIHGRIGEFPSKKMKTRPRVVHAHALVLRSKNRVLVQKRGEKGRFANLWEFPTLEFDTPVQSSELKRRFSKALAIPISRLSPLGTFRHKLTHRTIEMEVFSGSIAKDGAAKTGEWVSLEGFASKAFSRLQQRVAELGLAKSVDP